MFRQLYSALTSENTLDKAFEDLTLMLEHGAWMFARADEVLNSSVSAEQVRQPLYDRDRAINELERSIRRKVLRHLTVNPGHDVAICLALMSVGKDAERIGDYCKNVFEVGAFYTEGFHVPGYQEPLDRMAEQLSGTFDLLIEATRDGDEGQAQQVLATTGEIRSHCDRLIEALLREESQIEFHEAVAYSLLARHYKRVASHLANIATAVTGRLEDLDFPLEGDDEE
ncbi:phosphate signaling complex PhoU family protein [Halomonas heilongjiangensis]|uniref:PhoU family transcriptional regulator n=1 Tax=Halomonas heilongjiangensis TaxID=1387883 RepID=A0A2N7TLN4_9GAMM|nr:PhoU domain-containing protein [Halomonas heilongjiangensis]PMR69089.1 PhoU family transcriptional regulator [Halomonas heilongjiangensis]PXX94115.1 PhoU family transcriptional regulator [Halomonas heilongjiangensis]